MNTVTRTAYGQASPPRCIVEDVAGHASLVELAGVYHNLLRAWADS